MSKKNWLFLVIGSTIGTGVTFFARWVYKKLKKGKLDKWLSKEEKEQLIEAIEEFLKKEEKK